MTKERVIWTTLPNGWNKDGQLTLSLFISPRLSNADNSDTVRHLGEFPSFANWAAKLEEIRFRVQFDNGLETEGIPVERPKPALWERLFPPETPVKPYTFRDHARRNIHSFPVRQIHEFLRSTYASLGTSGQNVPEINDPPTGLLAPFQALENITSYIASPETNRSFIDEIERAYQKNDQESGQVIVEQVPAAGLSPQQQAVQNNFFQAYRFYSRPGSNRPDLPENYVEPKPEVPQFDFHQMVAQLGDYPQLLRQLGLIVDLVVELADPLSELPQEGVVRVVPEGDLPEQPPLTPGTRYELDEVLWIAKSKNDFLMSRGLLRLNPEFYDLVQVDVDGAVMQVVDFADSLRRMRDPGKKGPDTPKEAAAPALRSAGLTLARYNRAEQLLEDLKDQRDLNADIVSGANVVFHAEDLTRGYRVDVFDANVRRWFSLHQRIVTHLIDDPQGMQPAAEVVVQDEGYVKGTSAASERQDHPVPPSDDLYFHEAVFGWHGWSLSVPFPGKRIVEPGEGENGSTIEPYDPKAENPFAMSTEVSIAKGTLPRLRIGRTYRLRARTVDLAGNSRTFAEEDYEPDQEDLASEPETYVRFEPVPSPTVLRRHRDTEGESLEHLVIRSNVNTSAGAYAASAAVNDALSEAGVPHTYAEDSQRHLAAPKGSQQMAEQHGHFDAAMGGGPGQINAALRTALREEGTFLDELIVNINNGQKSVAQTEIALSDGSASLPGPDNRGAGLPQGVYTLYPDDHVELPYLPDPLAIGVALTGYDYAGQECFHEIALFPGKWPVLDPFRIRLSETNGPCTAKFEGGVLEVRLPQAEVINARLSSIMPDEAVEMMAIWQWMHKAAKTEKMKNDIILQGRHWMFTPFRWMTFTHAVQQPLKVPNMTGVNWKRDHGSTFVTFSGSIANHAKSTGRLDLYAEWTEDVDLITDDFPRMRALGTEVPHATHVFGFDIDSAEDAAPVTIQGSDTRLSRQEFGDTKHRRIVYHSVATTRFREFLPAPIAADLPRIQRVEQTTNEAGEEVQELVHHIRSSSRPAAPDVKYVLPTFRWEKDDDGDERKHIRRGKGLRIWLGRPWFSSGDDEQLAIILEPGLKLPPGWSGLGELLETPAVELANRPPVISRLPLRRAAAAEETSLIDSPLSEFPREISANLIGISAVVAKQYTAQQMKDMRRPYVTNWGSDPVWASARPDSPPTVAAFPQHTGFAAGLSLEELPFSVKVNAVVHDVHYDGGRGLWYCDIEVDPGDTYFPFVRLALARYQHYSLHDVHLSRVVMTDFIQLAPDRTTEISKIDDTTVEIKVRGYAGLNSAGHAEDYLVPSIFETPSEKKRPNTLVRAVVQQRQAGIPGDLGWVRVGQEITLGAESSGFFTTWKGTMTLPSQVTRVDHRILVTEIETYLRDYDPGDPPYSTSPRDFVRERIVFADVFDL